MLVSSILEKCIKTLFFPHRGGNFRSKFLSRQAYKDAANHFFEKRIDNCFRNYEVLRVLIKYNGIISNDIEENIQLYRVVRVIPPPNTMFKFIKINKIHTNINGSKLTFRKENNLRKKTFFFLSIQNQFKSLTLRFRFLQTLSYLPIF